jgi:O-antigen ligase
LRSHSRGGLLSVALTVAVMALLLFLVARPRLPTVAAVIGATCLAGWGFVAISGGGTLDRIGQIDANYDLDEAGRLTYWQVSLAMVAERPWQGFGYGNFEEAFAQHRDERFIDRVDMAHNTYIEHLVELGISATLLLYLGPLVLFLYCVRGLFVRRRNQVFPLAATGATVLVGLHALVDFSLQIPAIAVTYATLLGIGVAQATPSPTRAYGAASLHR